MAEFDASNPPEEGFQGIDHSSIDHEELPKPKFTDEPRQFGEKPLEPVPSEQKKTSVLAIVALVFAFIFWPVGLILGIIAIVRVTRNKSLKGEGLALAAIIVSILMPVGLIFIGAIAYFDILDPSHFLPDRCDFGTQLYCKHGQFSIHLKDGTLSGLATLQNNAGTDMIINPEASSCSYMQEDGQLILSDTELGAGQEFNVLCSLGADAGIGEPAKFEFSINWYPASAGEGFAKPVQGVIYSKVRRP